MNRVCRPRAWPSRSPPLMRPPHSQRRVGAGRVSDHHGHGPTIWWGAGRSAYGFVVSDAVIDVDDPGRDDVRALVERHLEFARDNSAPDDVHASDHDDLIGPGITLFSCRCEGRLVAIGALKVLTGDHVELKAVHTSVDARGHGFGRTLVTHLVAVAQARGASRVSLETGSGPAFEPARSLYASLGFEPCGPFAVYRPSASRAFMTLRCS